MYHYVNKQIEIPNSILFPLLNFISTFSSVLTKSLLFQAMWDFFNDPRAQCVKAAQLRRGQEQAKAKGERNAPYCPSQEAVCALA